MPQQPKQNRGRRIQLLKPTQIPEPKFRDRREAQPTLGPIPTSSAIVSGDAVQEFSATEPTDDGRDASCQQLHVAAGQAGSSGGQIEFGVERASCVEHAGKDFSEDGWRGDPQRWGNGAGKTEKAFDPRASECKTDGIDDRKSTARTCRTEGCGRVNNWWDRSSEID